MSRFWSKNVHSLTPYTPGEQPQIDNLIKLNTNENPYGPSPKVIQAIAKANGDSLRKYPDPNGKQLKKTIADYYQLQTEQVFIGNSSDEVLGHTFQALLKHSKPLLFADITYSFYPVYCALYEISYAQIALRDDFTINIDDYSIDNGGIILANPNAPSGIALELAQIKALLDNNPNSVVVIDEAYVDFGGHSAISLISQYRNLLITQTLSKSRSLAGLRVGFACGHADLIEALERVKNSFHPYALDSLALAGAKAAFEDETYYKECRAKVIATREATNTRLQALGFKVLPSSANFLFATHANHDAQAIFKALRLRGIVVRFFDVPRLDQYLRISIGTEQQMEQLIIHLEELLGAV